MGLSDQAESFGDREHHGGGSLKKSEYGSTVVAASCCRDVLLRRSSALKEKFITYADLKDLGLDLLYRKTGSPEVLLDVIYRKINRRR